MSAIFAERIDAETITLLPVEAGSFQDWLTTRMPAQRQWLAGIGFEGKAGACTLLPTDEGAAREAVLILSGPEDLWSWGGAATALPAGTYALPENLEDDARVNAALGWGLGSWRFDRYKKSEAKPRKLVVGDKQARKKASIALDGVLLARDLITTPASDMGPAELAEAASRLADQFGAKIRIIEGDALLDKNFPMIHAVGRASTRAPRLIELTWGKEKHPYLALVGKGVCFDTGGLDLKASSYMKMMKKDMGGAALALGLASMVMAAKLPVQLTLLIPAVENSVAGNAFRPLDILTSRKGLTVEIGNTDAEGRLVLADAITYAQEKAKPDLLIDFATLTGAARVALGTDLPALFCNDDALADGLVQAGKAVQDQTWRLPLHQGYRPMIEPKIADLSNAPDAPYGGAITAALFLESFVEAGVPWAHFDCMAWNLSSKPGRPEGGEGQAIRGVFHYLESRYRRG